MSRWVRGRLGKENALVDQKQVGQQDLNVENPDIVRVIYMMRPDRHWVVSALYLITQLKT